MTVEVIQTDEGIFYEDADGERHRVPCQWFPGCPQDATTTEPHPALGDVPVCDNCKAWCDRMRAR